MSRGTFIKKPANFAKSNASVLLDLIRGLAAVVVLLEHWRNILYIDFRDVSPQSLPMAAFYVLCTAGHQAVVIFFVLSGYLISGSVFRMLDRGTWSWESYLTHRLVRLWIVLIPGLLLCALWDGAGIRSGLAPRLYAGLSGDHMVGNVIANYTFQNFGASLVFLQTVLFPVFGSDGALWSLANEFWYYILFPLGLFALRRGTRLWARGICLVAFAVIAKLVGWDILAGLPIWLMGTLLALVPPPRLRTSAVFLGGAVYVPLFFLLGKTSHLPPVAADYLLGILTLGLLWMVLSAISPAKTSPGAEASRELARFSFTLYVGHMPLCVLLTAVLVGDQRWAPTPAHLFEGGVMLLVLIGYSYGLAFVTEFRTDDLRRRLENAFSVRKSSTRRDRQTLKKTT